MKRFTPCRSHMHAVVSIAMSILLPLEEMMETNVFLSTINIYYFGKPFPRHVCAMLCQGGIRVTDWNGHEYTTTLLSSINSAVALVATLIISSTKCGGLQANTHYTPSMDRQWLLKVDEDRDVWLALT